MKPNASKEYDSTKNQKEDKNAADKLVDKAREFIGVEDSPGAAYQNAPDEDESDVPKGDKVLKNRKTGEETHAKNTGDKY